MKTITRKQPGIALTAAALFSLLPLFANATVITEAFVNVAFEDGGTATGSFQWDSVTNKIFGQNISTSGGSTLPPFTYDTDTSVIYQFGFLPEPNTFRIAQCNVPETIVGCLGTIDRYISIKLSNPLSEAGGIDPFVLVSHLAAHDFNYECDNCEHFRVFVSGDLVGVAVPEPMILVLVGVGLAGVGLSRLKRP